MLESPLSPTLTTRTPQSEAGMIERLVQDHYGLRVGVERLGAEREEIFKLTDTTGSEYVLKVAHGREESGAIDFETRALIHVRERDPQLPTPRVIRTLDGRDTVVAPWGGSSPPTVRLFAWLPGSPLSTATRSPAQSAVLGGLLARVGRALLDFRHPAQGRHMDWDLRHTGRVAPLLETLPDTSRHRLATRFMAAFLDSVPDRLALLRSQVIYNDLNPHNVLVDPRDPAHITGIIDFGDIAHTALINDVAIAASYLTVLGATALEYPLCFVRAYHEVTPLEPRELELLYDLMAARLVMTVAITEWRASRQPHNRAYIQKNTALAWAGLERLSQVERASASTLFIDACAKQEITS